VCGVDPLMPMIGHARHKAARRRLAVDFQPGVIERLPYPDQTFDVVLSTFMMHQTHDEVKQQGLAEMARVLTPGGRLLIVDTKRPGDPHGGPAHPAGHQRPVHVGAWNSGVQDQPALMAAAGFVQIERGDLETLGSRLPEIGFALGRIRRCASSDSPGV
jgi:ubiquinone/menaquinone biosynthesis C-methylase UbiE